MNYFINNERIKIPLNVKILIKNYYLKKNS